MAKITQPDIYYLELDSHDIRILDYAICALKDRGSDKFVDHEYEKGYDKKLESIHDAILKVLRDGYA